MAHSIGAGLDGLAPAAPVGHVSRPPVIPQTASQCTVYSTVASQTTQTAAVTSGSYLRPECSASLTRQNRTSYFQELYFLNLPRLGQANPSLVHMQYHSSLDSWSAPLGHSLCTWSVRHPLVRPPRRPRSESTAYLDCRESGKRDRQSSPRILGYMGYVEPCGGPGGGYSPGDRLGIGPWRV